MTPTFDPQAYRRDLEQCVTTLHSEFGGAPDFAVVFGSGLGQAFREAFPGTKSCAYSDLPHLVPPHVEGHAGEAYRVYGSKIGSASALVLQGRNHFYEGLAPERLVFPVRALAMWGVKRLVLTNAAGSLRPRLRTGRLARISDHINLVGGNPLRGPNLDFLGPRFPSLDAGYENPFSQAIAKLARGLKMDLPKGVYVGIAGPSYETQAEIHAFRILGGDLVGMSTVYEAIAATHAGMQVAALSAVTNSCSQKGPLDHKEVLKNAKQMDGMLAKLLSALLDKGVA